MFKRYWKDFAIFWGLFIVFVAGVFFFFYLVSAGKLGFMPTFEELENPKNKFATEIYSEDGKILGKYFEGSENRRYMDYKDIPQSVIDALIATEDVRFYDHSGIAGVVPGGTRYVDRKFFCRGGKYDHATVGENVVPAGGEPELYGVGHA